MDNSRGHIPKQRSHRLAVGLLAIVLVVGVIWPLAMRKLHSELGGDIGSSLRVQDRISDLHEFYSGVQTYRKLHDGKNPPAFRAVPSGHMFEDSAEVETLTRKRPWKWVCVYSHEAGNDDPLLTCILVSPTPKVVVYLTGDGRVFVTSIYAMPRTRQSR